MSNFLNSNHKIKSRSTSFSFDILIVADDVVGEKMAGPGIRAWELANVLATKFKVALARPDYSPPELPIKPKFSVFSYTVGRDRELAEIVRSSLIILIQGYVLQKFPWIKTEAPWLIADMYVPFVLENLFIHQKKIPKLEDRHFIHCRDLQVFNELLLWADHFLCATEKQRDLLIGCLLSLNRINPTILEVSPDLNDLISLVPYGLQVEKLTDLVTKKSPDVDSPTESKFLDSIRSEIRGKLFPLKKDDILFLWGGVISNWFDPLTLIQALNEARKINPKIKLLFLSTTHPNPLLPKLDMAVEAFQLASSLGLLENHVFFNQEWIPYKKRGKYFMAADVAVSIHKIHFETHFSFRTRMLDYIKYELPILCTEGDYFADLVREKKLGLVVPEADVVALKNAMLELASSSEKRAEMKQNLRLIKEKFTWEKVSEPLVAYCEKVINGKIRHLRVMPSAESLLPLFLPKRESWLRRLSRQPHLWKILQKIPPFMAVPLKKLLK
ncbi:MAG: glycosyltransferase family 4 protein [Candidatus Aminicenantes bacterium]|nr:glycosyltransferase family 4 protein [Candidatus Aminicenantes bacterium]